MKTRCCIHFQKQQHAHRPELIPVFLNVHAPLLVEANLIAEACGGDAEVVLNAVWDEGLDHKCRDGSDTPVHLHHAVQPDLHKAPGSLPIQVQANKVMLTTLPEQPASGRTAGQGQEILGVYSNLIE